MLLKMAFGVYSVAMILNFMLTELPHLHNSRHEKNLLTAYNHRDISGRCAHTSPIRQEKVPGGPGLMGKEAGGDSLWWQPTLALVSARLAVDDRNCIVLAGFSAAPTSDRSCLFKMHQHRRAQICNTDFEHADVSLTEIRFWFTFPLNLQIWSIIWEHYKAMTFSVFNIQ